jgi:hypothetical protein
VGAPLAGVLPRHTPDSPRGLVLRAPSGTVEKLQPEIREGHEVRFDGGRSVETGVYLLQNETGNTLAAIPVNADTAESRLAGISDSTVLTFFHTGRADTFSVHVLHTGDAIPSAVDEARFGVELWKQFSCLALILAIAEMLIARISTRRTTTGGAQASGDSGGV